RHDIEPAGMPFRGAFEEMLRHQYAKQVVDHKINTGPVSAQPLVPVPMGGDDLRLQVKTQEDISGPELHEIVHKRRLWTIQKIDREPARITIIAVFEGVYRFYSDLGRLAN